MEVYSADCHHADEYKKQRMQKWIIFWITREDNPAGMKMRPRVIVTFASKQAVRKRKSLEEQRTQKDKKTMKTKVITVEI